MLTPKTVHNVEVLMQCHLSSTNGAQFNTTGLMGNCRQEAKSTAASSRVPWILFFFFTSLVLVVWLYLFYNLRHCGPCFSSSKEERKEKGSSSEPKRQATLLRKGGGLSLNELGLGAAGRGCAALA